VIFASTPPAIRPSIRGRLRRGTAPINVQYSYVRITKASTAVPIINRLPHHESNSSFSLFVMQFVYLTSTRLLLSIYLNFLSMLLFHTSCERLTKNAGKKRSKHQKAKHCSSTSMSFHTVLEFAVSSVHISL
jgi:hypothetical protein